MKIVIADDEVLVRKGICLTIPWQELGFDEVFEASDGEKALEIISRHPIDMLITDIRMPRMNGIELLEKVCEISPNTVNIVLSCVEDMQSVREAMKFNKAIDYIPKLTMNTEELKSIIRRACAYVKNSQHPEHTHQPCLPSFFNADHEKRLRNSLEYEAKEDVCRLLKEIFSASAVLEDQWRQSAEWDEIISVFASVGKKYEIYEKEYLTNTVRHLCAEVSSKEELEREILVLARWMKDQIDFQRKKSYDAGIRAASDYISANYEKNIRLCDVAARAGMSESYFSRYFKRVMGDSFSEYLNKVRVEKARNLLQQKRLTIQEVAESVGYSNAAYFTQIYKRLTGQSPKAYQMSLLKSVSGETKI